MNAKTLNDLLAESIDEVLDHLLGRKAREAIYDHLARNYSLAREEIPKNIEKFFKVTEETFGKGSRTIARCIAKRLFEKLDWKFEDIHGFEFQDYLEAARARIARELVEKAKASMLNRNQE
jgi:methylphosphotriester-DNA--protein-cysteine methyltransferase